MQKIVSCEKSYQKIGEVLKNIGAKKYMLVCSTTFFKVGLDKYFESIDIPCVYFSEFTPNPKYEEICKGADIFEKEGCDAIVAVGGGSAIDVAKGIKAFYKMDRTKLCFNEKLKDSKIPLLAVPTTAGTGSESTRFAVFYYGGEKQSLGNAFLLPEYAFLDPTLLYTLPEYQKKCTLLDALCQAIESWWSVNSNDESKLYAKTAVEKIVNNYRGYLFENDSKSTEEIMQGSNLAGRAINITATTSAHAMSYKMTTLYGIPHGHAVGIGLAHIFEYMVNNTDKCTDSRGEQYLTQIFNDIAVALGAENATEGVKKYKNILKELEIEGPIATKEELDVLASSVNVGRLKNNPVALSYDALYNLYCKITKR